MIKRVVEIGHPAFAHLSRNNLVVDLDAGKASIPLEDLGVLLIDDPGVTMSAALHVACGEAQVAVIVCDRRHLPVGLSLPVSSNSLHPAVLRTQIEASVPTRKRAWQGIIRAKIRNQATILDLVGHDGGPLRALTARVRSGDPSNVEATAARRYWVALFGPDFRRDPDLDGTNALLNYGYAVLRAAVARAVCSTGLHPAIGVHHSNQYNSFALADDLVEPLRPAVDRIVLDIVSGGGSGLDRNTKQALLGVLQAEFRFGDEVLQTWTVLPRYVSSLVRLLEGDGVTLQVPQL
jgi:CRISPR-associated protein Cas1